MLSKAKGQWIRSLKIKKFREEIGYYIAEGEKIVRELIASDSDIDAIYVTEQHQHLFQHPAVWVVTEKEFATISNLETPSGCLAVVKIPEPALQLLSGNILILDAIRDPGNLGTIIRTADWFGINAIVCSPDCVDAFNPKTVQSSMGSVLRVAMFYLPLVEFIQKSTLHHFYISHLEGEELGHQNIKQPFGLIIGNESKGVRDELLQTKHLKLRIEGNSNRAESLNAAVANGVLLHHFFKYI